MSVEVKMRKGEPLEKALRRLKKKLDREGILRAVKAKRYFEKPCEVRRQKKRWLHLIICCATSMILRKNFVGYIVNGGRRAIRGVIALRFFILSALNFFVA